MSPIGTPAIKIVRTVREQVSPEEWDIRVNLAACYRLTELFGMTDLTANHISFRLPNAIIGVDQGGIIPGEALGLLAPYRRFA